MEAGRYTYFEHDADVGLAGRGATLEEAFEAAAAGMFAIVTDLAGVRRERTIKLEFEEADVQLALVRWLNLLLATARDQSMVFAEFHLERDGVVWRGRELIAELAAKGILICTRSMRGAAEEAPGAYKDVDLVAESTEKAGLARRVALLRPKACVKG